MNEDGKIDKDNKQVTVKIEPLSGEAPISWQKNVALDNLF